MDSTEAIAEIFLKSRFSMIEYEPDGNIPPDFLCDGNVAVEVRLLNQNYEAHDGTISGLESDDRRLAKTLEKVYSQYKNSTPGESWYVHHQFKRPLEDKGENIAFAKRICDEFRSEPKEDKTYWNEKYTLALSFQKQSVPDTGMFILGGWNDLDSGGYVESELIRNLEFCVQQKANKVQPHRCRYSCWWLILVDSIGRAGTKPEIPVASPYHATSAVFDQIFLLGYDGKSYQALK